MPYPPTMAKLPPFEQCFTNVIAKAMETSEEVLNDVLLINTPLLAWSQHMSLCMPLATI